MNHNTHIYTPLTVKAKENCCKIKQLKWFEEHTHTMLNNKKVI